MHTQIQAPLDYVLHLQGRVGQLRHCWGGASSCLCCLRTRWKWENQMQSWLISCPVAVTAGCCRLEACVMVLLLLLLLVLPPSVLPVVA
jgi:hypothetical protein